MITLTKSIEFILAGALLLQPFAGAPAQVSPKINPSKLPALTPMKKSYAPITELAIFDAAHPVQDVGYLSWTGGETFDPSRNVLRLTGGHGFYGGSPANQVSVAFLSSKGVQNYEVTFTVQLGTPSYGNSTIYRIGEGSTSNKRDEPFGAGRRQVALIVETGGSEGMRGVSFGTHDSNAHWALLSVVVRKHRAKLGG